MKVTNTSDSTQSVMGIPTFASGETRTVSEEEGKRLLQNPNFQKESASEKRRKDSLKKESKAEA